ncbi:MAG TPA: arginase [Chloroflexota bacterium]|nr:arginase [Chloroflexota bacterium]
MRVAIIGAPIDFGASRRGVDMGCSAIRYAGLQSSLQRLGHDVVDLGNVRASLAEQGDAGDPRLKHLDEILAASRDLADLVAEARADDRLPVILGGDHSIALGSIAGAARGRTLGVLWIDAHGDYNTHETTPSGNIHGMPLAASCGLGDPRLVNLAYPGPKVDPRHVALVGVRDLDEPEKALLRQAGVSVFTMQHIDRQGMDQVMAAALKIVSDGTDGVLASVDLDVLDPREAPGVGTPVAGGISYREAHLIMELLAESGHMVALDLVEVNPILDRENGTARLAAELALSALGKRIF